MDHDFTEHIKQWLETPEAERDYTVGERYLLKLSGNQILYRNIISQIDRRIRPRFVGTISANRRDSRQTSAVGWCAIQ